MIEFPVNIHTAAGEKVTIRPASLEELPELIALLSQMHDKEPWSSPDALRETYEEILTSDARLLLVAVHDGNLVGTLDLITVSNLTHDGKPWAAIENVIVDVGYRRLGIGGALLDTAIEIARALGCYKLQLVSHQKRDAAHALYRHAGFDAPVQGYRRYLDGR